MLSEKVLVRSGGEIVATVDVEQFESLGEAQEALGEDTVLAFVNAQHKANETNKARGKATEAGRKELSELAKKLAKMTPEQRKALGM